MTTQVLEAASETALIVNGINRVLIESGRKTCGVILGEYPLDESRLMRLKEAVAAHETDRASTFLCHNNILVILLPDKELSYTHFLSLSVQQFLQEENQAGGNLVIASFSGLTNEADGTQMLQMIRQETDYENTILIYNQSEPKKEKPTILIIDDDKAVGELLDSRLMMRGYDVYKADSGLEGMRLFDSVSPDLVITELALPVYDGFEVIRNIRNKAYKECNIMVLSNKRLERDISTCFELGVSDYITKPYSPVELEARIRRLLA
ncbi:response regulator transcription factor [Aneurinibacillus sp. Ricciae_BoGa-3]|uniref:response regulator transcription factor n=1 Tax=Aneurinibacillus sp. Ricciae_BoGa-3 TaxID=3022697 RepID=UPI002341B0C9|nr:response regulator transcription factor [Aneurinibacillus sp. Ricciae_BoGa-3]WCK53211.1 response regulator transcription factor [Aneurinibacillus sp. Ricciae_BoGa-3]